MKIHYRKIENGIEIVRCYGTDSLVVLPKQIEDEPVIRVAAYTFSARKREEDEDVLEYQTECSFLSEGSEHLLAGLEVTEVVFPDSVESIGNYIFYGCKALKRLEFSNKLMDIGSGAFTGCDAISKLDVHLKGHEKSCVKEILGDLWQRIDVTFYCDKRNEIVNLVFPEHYEEAVENTPARILFTQHHGSGNNYRQCFTAKEVDYRKYDELFSVAKVYDKMELLIDLVFARLLTPCDLSEKHRRIYENYVRENLNEILQKLIKRNENSQEERKIFTILQEITRIGCWTKETLDLAVELCVTQEQAEIAAWLMNERHRLFPEPEKVKTKKKKFAL